jgi:hypothetical protein
MLRMAVLFAGLLIVLSVTVPSPAQEVVVLQLYGSGVHAYFAGDFAKAYDQMTAAIAAGTRDPRIYYFRGLAYLKLGREAEATQDFQKGAQLESKDLHRAYNVGRALERVQGAVRQQLETYRVDARLAAFKEDDKIQKARYEAIQREEKRVLRSQAAQAPVEPIATPNGQPAAKAAETDPFGNPPAEPAEPPKGGEQKAAEPPVEKPAEAGAFGSGDAAEKPAEPKTTPFQEEPATPATPAASNKTPPKQSILGAFLKGTEAGIKKSIGSASSLGNMLPIGKGPGGTMPAGIPGASPAPAAIDPFGASGEQPAPPKKAEAETPAAPPSVADPFATGPEEKKAAPPEKPAEPKPAEKDPFAG